MAYNKKNLLERVLDVQNVYKQHKTDYTTNAGIFREFIEPKFRISKGTFYRYLTIPALAELKKLKK